MNSKLKRTRMHSNTFVA